MERKVIIKYLIFSFLLLIGAFFTAFKFSWLYDSGGSNAGKQMFIFILPIGLTWFGCLYLTIFINRLLFSKNILIDSFLGPLDINDEKVFDQLGTNFRRRFPFILFPIFLLLTSVFKLFIDGYERKELSNFGVEKVFRIDSISFSKGFRMIHVRYNFNNKTRCAL